MIWPFKRKEVVYPGGAAEAVGLLYNHYLLKMFKDYPGIKEATKLRIPDFDECNILYNICAINTMFSFKIRKLEYELKTVKMEIETLKEIQRGHGCYK